MKLKELRINDKHVEVILPKNVQIKVIVETVGDTTLIPGDFITKTRFEEINAEIFYLKGGEPATARQTILGVTKSSLFSDSWLSSSFVPRNDQSFDRSFTWKGREDKLVGT